MGHAEINRPMTAQEFLDWDATQELRHEFADGEVFAMAGTEDRHGTVTGNPYMALRSHLTGTPCRTYSVDLKLHVARANSYFCRDVFVTCNASDHASRLSKQHPKLVIEVLSPGTASYDRSGKFARCRLIDELQEYGVIDIAARRADVFRKGADGLWVLHPFEAGETVHLASVDLSITAEALFAEVDPPEAA